jgi:KUP system potassium uptake protein
MRLNMWFKQRVIYTSNSLGQIYVPSVNLLLGIGCILITLYFEKSENMEAAYGLSISLTMLMTSILIGYFMWYNAKFPKIVVLGYFLVHGGIEISFLTANLSKFSHGGYVTLLIAGGIAFVMYVAYQGRKIRNRLVEFVDVRKYLSSIGELSVDATVPKYATHLVYLTKADNTYEVEKKVIYSIFENQPKRADVYWLVHIDVLDTPNTMEYSVTTIKDDDLIRVDFRVGFRVEQRVNLMFKMVLEEVCKNKEVHFSSPYAHINEQIITGDHKFVVIEKILSAENNLPWFDKFITDFYILLKRFSISDVKAYHLDRSSVVLEQVSLFITERKPLVMKRIEDKTKKEKV